MSDLNLPEPFAVASLQDPPECWDEETPTDDAVLTRRATDE